MGKAAVFSKFADTSLLEIAADLRFVVAMDGADVIFSREVLRHGLHTKTQWSSVNAIRSNSNNRTIKGTSWPHKVHKLLFTRPIYFILSWLRSNDLTSVSNRSQIIHNWSNWKSDKLNLSQTQKVSKQYLRQPCHASRVRRAQRSKRHSNCRCLLAHSVYTEWSCISERPNFICCWSFCRFRCHVWSHLDSGYWRRRYCSALCLLCDFVDYFIILMGLGAYH